MGGAWGRWVSVFSERAGAVQVNFRKVAARGSFPQRLRGRALCVIRSAFLHIGAICVSGNDSRPFFRFFFRFFPLR
jgi:hypothetical protein